MMTFHSDCPLSELFHCSLATRVLLFWPSSGPLSQMLGSCVEAMVVGGHSNKVSFWCLQDALWRIESVDEEFDVLEFFYPSEVSLPPPPPCCVHESPSALSPSCTDRSADVHSPVLTS